MLHTSNLEKAHNAILLYTLEHAKNDPTFIHQNAVDAWAAQYANKTSKKISTAFALIGLYLFLEKGFTGKAVQDAHVQLAKQRKEWPSFVLPQNRGDITVCDVLAVQPGNERDKMIRKWCESVWHAYTSCHNQVAQLVFEEPAIVVSAT